MFPSNLQSLPENKFGAMGTQQDKAFKAKHNPNATAFSQIKSGSKREPLKLKSTHPANKVEIVMEEVVLMEKTISENIIHTMNQFLNKHEMGKGIWYPDDYKKYLMDEFHMEMDEFYHTGYADEKFFEKIGPYTFKLKEGQKASEALLSFLEGPTIADCGNATMACYYMCILDIIGQEKFDQLFGHPSFTLLISQGYSDQKTPLAYLVDYTETSKKLIQGVLGKRPLKIGEECHFDGIPWYASKHPEGFSGGWNVIYIGDDEEGNQLFVGHGFEKPLTEKEINQKFVELYNQERTLQDNQYIIQTKKPHLYDRKTNCKLASHYTLNLEEVEKNTDKFIKGFLVGSARRLQANKLFILKNSDNLNEFILRQRANKISYQIF